MRPVFHLIKHKRSVRRLLATGFLVLMLADIGAHAIIDNQDPDSLSAAWCKVLHHLSPSADCPHKRHQGFPQANLSNDITHYWIMLADLTVPVSGIVYTTPAISTSAGDPIDRALAPPFQPPKQI